MELMRKRILSSVRVMEGKTIQFPVLLSWLVNSLLPAAYMPRSVVVLTMVALVAEPRQPRSSSFCKGRAWEDSSGR